MYKNLKIKEQHYKIRKTHVHVEGDNHLPE
jgi:hypothetical protein